MKFLSLVFLFISFNLSAAEKITIENPIVRLTPPGITTTAAFLKITNKTDKDIRLVKVTGDFAGTFELHDMEMAGGKMKMRSVQSILVLKGASTELKSGGLHIMIFNVKKPLIEGEFQKFKLFFDDKSEISVKAKVEKLN